MVQVFFLKQLWLTFGASLAFLIIGLVRGYSASAIPSMEANDPDLIAGTQQKSWIGAIPPLGAFLGSMMSGAIMQKAGRKRTLQMTAPLWAAGWLILGLAPSFPLILLGRVLTGFCVGLVLAPVQVYISECCDPEIRGQLGSLPTLSMSSGIVISYVAGNWLYWRHLAFMSAAFCGALFFALLHLPESPVWLEAHSLDPAASIKWLNLSKRAMAPVAEDVDEKQKIDEPTAQDSVFSKKILFSSVVYKPLIIGFSLLFFQQFSGIDAVIFFTVEIFETAAVVMCLSMTAMGAAFFFQFENKSWLGYLPVVSLIVFMLGFSLGFGGLPFLLLGELFPVHHRSQLSAMASAVNLLSMFTIIKTYHSLEALLTSAGTFWMYACFCAIAFVFVLFAVPETKGKSLGEIEHYFRSKKEKAISLNTIA